MQVSQTAARPRAPRDPKAAARRRDDLSQLLDPGFFAAIAEPNRARIVACVARCRRACAVSEIAECCDIDLSVVSRHLRALSDAGVLGSEKVGRTVHYRLNSAELVARLRALADALESSAPMHVADRCCGQACAPRPCAPRRGRAGKSGCC